MRERALLHEVQHVAHAQHADDLVGLARVDEQAPVVGGRDLLRDLLERRFEVDRLDLVARHHHVVDRHGLQVEEVEEDALVLLREIAGLEHERAQLLDRERVLAPPACGLRGA